MADKAKVEKKGVKWLVVVPLIIVILLAGLGGYLFLNNGYDFSVEEVEESSIDVDQVLMKVMLKDSDTLVKELRVMNTGDAVEEVSVSSNMGDMVVFSEESFSIEPGQTKVLEVGFRSFVEQTSVEYSNGIYVGELVIDDESVPVVVEVESEEVLFDMNINFPVAAIEAGDDVNVEVRLYNLMDTSAMSINVEYFVKDLTGNVLFTESETVVVDTQVSFTKTIGLPDSSVGTYVFGSVAKYAGSTGTSSYLFEVGGEEEEVSVGFCPINNPLCMMMYGVFVLLFVFLLFVLLYFLKDALYAVFGRVSFGLGQHVKNKSFVYTMLIVLLTLLVVLLVYVLNNGSFDVFSTVPVQVYVALLVLVGVFVIVYVVYAFLKSFGSVANYFREKRKRREEKLEDLERMERRKQVTIEKQRLVVEKEKQKERLAKKKKRSEVFKKIFGVVFFPFVLVGKVWTGFWKGLSDYFARRKKLKEMRALEKQKLKHLKEVKRQEVELLRAKKDAEAEKRVIKERAKSKREVEKKALLREKRRKKFFNSVYKVVSWPFRGPSSEEKKKQELEKVKEQELELLKAKKEEKQRLVDDKDRKRRKELLRERREKFFRGVFSFASVPIRAYKSWRKNVRAENRKKGREEVRLAKIEEKKKRGEERARKLEEKKVKEREERKERKKLEEQKAREVAEKKAAEKEERKEKEDKLARERAEKKVIEAKKRAAWEELKAKKLAERKAKREERIREEQEKEEQRMLKIEEKKLEDLEKDMKKQEDIKELQKKEVKVKTDIVKREKILELERESFLKAKKDRSFFKNVQQNVQGYLSERKHKSKQKELKRKFGERKG